jgi:hypothetical protein
MTADDRPMTQSFPTARTARALRASAWATFAYALFQGMVLPMPLYRDSGGEWVFEHTTVLSVAATVAMGVFLWRRNLIAGVLAGLYGVWRVWLVIIAVVWVLNGTAVRVERGVTWVLGQAVVLPLTIVWLRGGWVMLREWRMRTHRVSDAAEPSFPDDAES